jgi:eukaryotic-like serine/threonine-protein kinase
VSDPTALAHALAARYRIERALGAGGMATVYLARDLKHDRQVAIKVLKPELAAVLGADRFLKEITVTASLQHPHILPLHDSGEADGLLYYVMPFVAGESLREKLRRERRLAIDDAVQITTTIAGALDFAHQRGIVHRDIKPENILLQAGVALIADFGIALAVTSAGGERLTETGLSLGTPAYMSPEQIAGERDPDARSDVYALACVTYEMLGGDPPFLASSAQAVMAKHITDPAPPITTTRPDVTPAFARALARALRKAPADRYASAGAFAQALTERPGTADATTAAVLVLPFTNQSPDRDNEYFADGLTEEIISDLSRLQGLRVISRNSAMTLKGSKRDTPTLARELNVSHIVTGSVRRAGNALRVTAELVEGASDAPRWSDKYAGTVEDIFGIQEEIARKIVSALEVTLTPKEEREIGKRPIEDPVAYDCYLRARQEMYVWTPEALGRAHQLVDEALRTVGETPLLLATKAELHWMAPEAALVEAERDLGPASALVERALALDPDFPLAIFVRGLVEAARGRLERALPDLYRAHALWPGDGNIVQQALRHSVAAGLRDQWTLVERAIAIDPLTPVTWLGVSAYHWTNGEYAKVGPAARRALELAPLPSMLHVLVAWHLLHAGFTEEGCRVLGAVGERLVGTPIGSWALFLSYAREGDADRALAQVTPAFERVMRASEFNSRIVAEGYALLGRSDDALRWLRASIDRGFINYPHTMDHDRFLDNIRKDPRFAALMSEVKPRWEAIVAWERKLHG